MNDEVVKFVNWIINMNKLEEVGFAICSYDLKEIYFTGESGNSYFVRMWNVDKEGINYTVYYNKNNKTVNSSGYYPFNKC